MKSMTGYGKGDASESGRTLTVELKSVNHRFLDISVKQPKQFVFAEDIIRRMLQSSFARGHIDVYVTYEDNSKNKKTLALDKELAENYLCLARRLAVELSVPNDLTAATLLRFEGIVTESKTETDESILTGLLTSALSKATEALAKMRGAEGETLAAFFEGRLPYIKALIAKAAERAPQIALDYREKLEARIKEALDGIQIDEARLINEAAFFTDKANIDEELTRLDSHMAQFEELLTNTDSVGRKLDFLLQEMNREVNTMGSKANDTVLLSIVVELKTELEKIREQIQNIE